MSKVTFDTQALEISKQYDLGLDSVKKAYTGNPERLSTLFNQMSAAKHKRNVDAVITLVTSPAIPSLLFFVPLIAAYKTWEHHNTVRWVGDEVHNDVVKSEAATATIKPPAPPSGP